MTGLETLRRVDEKWCGTSSVTFHFSVCRRYHATSLLRLVGAGPATRYERTYEAIGTEIGTLCPDLVILGAGGRIGTGIGTSCPDNPARQRTLSGKVVVTCTMDELTVENAAMSEIASLGFSSRTGGQLDDATERPSFAVVILPNRLNAALHKLNPHLPAATIAPVTVSLSRPPHPTLIENNRHFHGLLTDGVPVEYKDAKTGEMRGGRARLIDFDNPANNDFLVVRQADHSRHEWQDDPPGPDPVRQRAAAGGDRVERPGERVGRPEHGDRPVRALQGDRAGPVRAEPAAGGERRAADAGGEHHQRAATLHAVAAGRAGASRRWRR